METQQKALDAQIKLIDLQVPTRWGNQLNGNENRRQSSGLEERRPYSLGKSVEWKPPTLGKSLELDICPYSLGKSVEWKP
jgi:hypothetical protein